MKKISILSIFAAAALASAETLTYSGSGNFVDAASWLDESGNPSTTAPTSTTDVVFKNTAINAGGVFNFAEVNSITFNKPSISNVSPTLTLGSSLLVKGDISYTSEYSNLVSLYLMDGTATVNGKVTVSATGTNSAWFGFSNLLATKFNQMKEVTIKGGVVLNGTNSRINFNAGTVNITNKVLLNGSNNALYLMRIPRTGGTYTSNVNLDGLDGAGRLCIGSSQWAGSGTSTAVANMIFTNSTNSEFSGTGKTSISDAEFGYISADSKINIEMNAKSATAKQTLRLAKGIGANVADSVSVKNGVLSLYGATTFADLSISGGKFSSAADSAPLGYDIGTSTFTSASWSGGTILTEIANPASFDKIVITGAFDKVGTDALTLELDFDIDVIQNLIDNSEDGKVTFANIISYASTNLKNSDVNVVGPDTTMLAKDLEYALDFGETGLSLSISNVPEPAEWAAIFGALALALALYRRRK